MASSKKARVMPKADYSDGRRIGRHGKHWMSFTEAFGGRRHAVIDHRRTEILAAMHQVMPDGVNDSSSQARLAAILKHA